MNQYLVTQEEKLIEYFTKEIIVEELCLSSFTVWNRYRSMGRTDTDGTDLQTNGCKETSYLKN